MPEPAGTGLSRRSFLLRSRRARPGGLRRRQAGQAAAVRDRRRAGAGAPGRGTVLLNVFLDGGVDSLSRAGAGRGPALPPAAPDARASRDGRAFAEDARLRWHPSRQRAGRPARRGQGLGAARGRLHRRRPVALHLAPLLGGRRAGPAPAHGLARARARPRRLARQPAAGRVAGRPALAALATRATRSPRSTSPRTSGFWTPGAWGAGRGARRARRSRSIGRALRGSADPAVAQAARAAAFAGGVRDALAPLGKDGKPAYTPAAAYPQSAEPSRSGSPASPRCSPPGLPIRAAVDPRARRLRHARQPGGVAAEEPASSRSTRCSPSSATSRRAGWPTAC